MNKLLLIFIYELRRNFRRPGYLFTTFGVPVLAAVGLLIYSALSGGGDDPSGAIQNTNDILAQIEIDPETAQPIGYIDETGLVSPPEDIARFFIPFSDEAAAQAALEADEIGQYVLIPEDYIATGNVTTVMPSFAVNELDNSRLRGLLLGALTTDVDPQIVTRLINPANFDITNLALTATEDGTPSEDATFLIVYVFALALMLGLFATNGYLMQSVIEEKETRLVEILLASVRPSQLLTGKILAMGLLGLLQMAVWIGGMFVISRLVSGGAFDQSLALIGLIAGIRFPVEIVPLLVLYYLFAYFLFAALFAAVGALSNSMREGPQYTVLFVLPAALPLYFIPVFASSPDAPLPTILSLFPLTAPIAMAQRLVVSTVPVWQIVVSLGLLALASVGVMWLAGRLFRVQVLLAGQMPKLRDLPRLVRG